MLIAALYVLCIIAANFTAGTLIGFGFVQFAVGTIFFGPIFTLRDMMHSTEGRAFVYRAIAVAVGVNFAIALTGGFDMRILIASCVALALSELTDTEIFHRFRGSWLTRVLSSNSVSIPLDTVLFTCIAFLGNPDWPLWLLGTVIITDCIVKALMASFVIPFYYAIVRKPNYNNL